MKAAKYDEECGEGSWEDVQPGDGSNANGKGFEIRGR